MNVTKNDLGKSQIEFTVELTVEEFTPYITKGAEKLSKEIKVDGFRAGHIPFEVIKQKVGEITILEEAANIAINKTMAEVYAKHMGEDFPFGQPSIRITKLASGNPLEYKVTVTVLPKVKLGEYKNLAVEKEKAAVEEEDIEKVMDNLRESRVKEVIAEREVKENDKVIADIELFLDNVPIEGGKGTDTAVVIGKKSFIPGFEQKLIGMKKGETREFSLPFPADYHQKNLAGKMGEFKVTVKEVYERQFPEMNDELGKTFGFKNLEELKVQIRKDVEKGKNEEAERKIENEIIEKIVKNARVDDIPEEIINEETHAMMHEIEHDIEHQGGKFEDYLTSLKKSKGEFMLELSPEAVRRIKIGLILREIIKVEKIEVPEEEIDKKIEDILKQYKGYQKVEEKVKEPEYRRQLYSTLLNQKVMEKLKEWNIKKVEI